MRVPSKSPNPDVLHGRAMAADNVWKAEVEASRKRIIEDAAEVIAEAESNPLGPLASELANAVLKAKRHLAKRRRASRTLRLLARGDQ